MITHQANGNKFLIMEVPKKVNTEICSHGLLVHSPTIPEYIIPLPYGTYTPLFYTPLFIAEEATEEQAAMVVEKFYYDGWNYCVDLRYTEVFDTAIEALQSLIAANFNNDNYNHLILKID